MITIETTNYKICKASDSNHGFFEHKTLGDDYAGGLWFNNNKLIDTTERSYDGCFELDEEITDALTAAGFDVSEIIDV